MNLPKLAKYLEKRTHFDQYPLECSGNLSDIDLVVSIPVLGEGKELSSTLTSLAENSADAVSHALVICVVNDQGPQVSLPEDLRDNEAMLLSLREAIAGRVFTPFAGVRLALVDASTGERHFGKKDGVGLARKIGLDWGLRILTEQGATQGALVCLDADTRVSSNYLESIREFFRAKEPWAGIASFAHPTHDGDTVIPAIIAYEIYLRAHVLGLRWAGSPYAFHTVGSTMACSPEAYLAVNGMNRRQGAEDFYFLQELAKTGSVQTIPGATVYPASRVSHRVPFGTGRALGDYAQDPAKIYRLYHPESYAILKAWLGIVEDGLDSDGERLLRCADAVDATLSAYLSANEFAVVWNRMRDQARDRGQAKRQFHRWFDAFRTLKLLHHLRDCGRPDLDLFQALGELCDKVGLVPPTPLSILGREDLKNQQKLLQYLRRVV